MTQLEKARAGSTTPEMKIVAEKEQVEVLRLRDRIAEGRWRNERLPWTYNIDKKLVYQPDLSK